jgi:stage II sporulation protein M
MSYRWWLFTVVSLFVIGIVFGAYSYGQVPATASTQTTELQYLTDLILSLPRPAMMTLIFLKNTFTVFLSILFSPILLLVPVLTLLLNGWLIGVLSGAVIQERSVAYLLLGLLPHGVFELPALFLGEAIAFSVGTAAIRAMMNGKADDFKMVVKSNARLIIPIIILFAVAAAVETYVTPAALNLAI